MPIFAFYLTAFLVVLAGLAFAAYLLNLPVLWIAVGVVVVLALAFFLVTSRRKLREPKEPTTPTGPGSDER